MKMKAIARFGKEFGSYRMVEVPYPTCGPEDIILEIKAAAICGADMNTGELIMVQMNSTQFVDMSLPERSYR